MTSPEPSPSAFDELLDLRFRGVAVDAEAFLAAHPELTEAERAQLLSVCNRRTGEAPSSDTAPAFEQGGSSESPPVPRIGDYRLGRRIGSGGMGAVFLAHDEALGRPAAVKILGPDFLGTGERSERFLREARAVARLSHPNVVDVYAAGEQDGFRYLAMELVTGSSLHDMVADAAARGTRLAIQDVVRWGIEIARALQAAHDASIVHRDVKPSNIRIADDGRAVLLDFGLVLEDGAASLTLSGGFRGSPQYASPEQVGVAGVPIDSRTDVYSLGATLYEALTGVAPFRGETRDQLFHAILSREPVAPRRLDASIPRDLETVVLAALEKDPARRYATAAALGADLEAVRDGRAVSVRPISAPGRLFRWARRQPVKAALLAAAVIGTLAAAGLGGFVLSNLSKIEKATLDERAARVADLVTLGFLDYGEGDPARALGLFEEAMRLDGSSHEAQAGYALALIERGAPGDAIAFLERRGLLASGMAWPEHIRRLAVGKGAATTESHPHGATQSALDEFVLGMTHLDWVHQGHRQSLTIAFDRLHRAVLSAPQAIPIYHYELGHAAWHAGRHAEARAIAEAIVRLRPESPERTFAIARTLLGARRDQALDLLEKAARDPPRSTSSRVFIVVQLARSGRGGATLDLALDLAKQTVALDPASGKARVALGSVHLQRKEIDEALAAAEEGVRLEPKQPDAQRMLAQLLSMRRRLEEALPHAREAVRLRPAESGAWNVLGAALMQLRRFDESLAAFDEGLKADPNDAAMLCNVGKVLMELGRFDEALIRLRAGHEKGSKLPDWNNPSKQLVADAERVVALEGRLEKLRKDPSEPLTPENRVALAWAVCRPKKLFAEGAGLYADALRSDPSLASQESPDHVLRGAILSVSAGFGQGRNAPADPAERARLRKQARAWLQDESRAMAELLESQPSAAHAIRLRAKSWLDEPAFAVVRAPDADALPQDEAAAWRALWEQCERLSR
jgi:tetratricopeptide (TPR) repeat protein